MACLPSGESSASFHSAKAPNSLTFQPCSENLPPTGLQGYAHGGGEMGACSPSSRKRSSRLRSTRATCFRTRSLPHQCQTLTRPYARPSRPTSTPWRVASLKAAEQSGKRRNPGSCTTLLSARTIPRLVHPLVGIGLLRTSTRSTDSRDQFQAKAIPDGDMVSRGDQYRAARTPEVTTATLENKSVFWNRFFIFSQPQAI